MFRGLKSLPTFAAVTACVLIGGSCRASVISLNDNAFNPRATCQYMPAGLKVNRKFLLVNNSSQRRLLRVTIDPRLSTAQGTVKKLTTIELARVLEPHKAEQVSVLLDTPAVPHNSYYSLILSVHQGKTLCWLHTESFILVPQGVEGTEAHFAGIDPSTSGNWLHHYGTQAFYLSVQNATASMNQAMVTLGRGSGREQYNDTPLGNLQEVQIAQKFWADKPVQDTRVPYSAAGFTKRIAVAFSTQKLPEYNNLTHKSFTFNVPLVLRAFTTDNAVHMFSLYFLDFKRENLKQRLDLYDKQGQLLDSRQIPPFGDGLYMRYRIKGSVVAVITPETKHSPVCSGMFLDPAPSHGFLWSKE